MTPKLFGEAVHAVLPFLRVRGSKVLKNPLAVNQHTIRDFLKIYINDRFTLRKEKISDAALRNIVRCWIYVINLIGEADHYWIEPRFSNGSSPDLVLIHQKRVYVIDLKTGLLPKSDENIFKQIVEPMEIIWQRMPIDPIAMYGYVLHMYIVEGPQNTLEYDWKLIAEHSF